MKYKYILLSFFLAIFISASEPGKSNNKAIQPEYETISVPAESVDSLLEQERLDNSKKLQFIQNSIKNLGDDTNNSKSYKR